MINSNLSERLLHGWPLPESLREHSYAFLYWLAFLLVLEPGNVFRANQSGMALVFSDEVIRIAVAAFLGMLASPILRRLTQRFSVFGKKRWRHLLIHSASIGSLAFILIAVSCFLAAWLFTQRWLPTLTEVHDQQVNNFLLLVFALSAYTVISHLMRLTQQTGERQEAKVAAQGLTRVEVKTRGRLSLLELSAVDWIETQGNYLALHAGSETHLIRETLVKFKARLDPLQFLRIHRRLMVAITRISDIQFLENGDALIQLVDGCELRASRSYRAAIKDCWVRLE